MEKRQEPATVVQYVYETAAKTFDGPIGGYMTVPAAAPESTPDSNSNDNSNNNSNDNSNSNAQQAAQESAAAAEASASAVSAAIAEASSSNAAAAATTEAAHTQNDQKTQVTSTPANKKTTNTSTPPKAVSSPTQTSAAAATSQASSPSPTSSYLESTSSTAPSHTAAASTGSSGGMSSGGKAGLAIGILLILGILFALAFFVYRRKRTQSNEEYSKADNEKSDFNGGLARSQSNVSTRTTATAPRLSLRPITEFHPDLAARGKAANAGAAAAAGVAGGAAVGAAMSRNQNDPANPFGNHAAVTSSRRLSDEKVGLPIQSNASENPFADNAGAPPPTNGSMPLADAPAPLRIRTPSPDAGAAAGAAAVAGAAAGAAVGAKLGERKDAPKPLNLTPNRAVTPAGHSPAVSEFSQTPVSPGAMANGPPPSNVHRIQLDFKPSMDDELSLRAGQLVRLLHEYDDGWVSGPSNKLKLIRSLTIVYRLFAFVLTVLSKVSRLVPASQLVLSSLVQPQAHVVPVLAVHHLREW